MGSVEQGMQLAKFIFVVFRVSRALKQFALPFVPRSPFEHIHWQLTFLAVFVHFQYPSPLPFGRRDIEHTPSVVVSHDVVSQGVVVSQLVVVFGSEVVDFVGFMLVCFVVVSFVGFPVVGLSVVWVVVPRCCSTQDIARKTFA